MIKMGTTKEGKSKLFFVLWRSDPCDLVEKAQKILKADGYKEVNQKSNFDHCGDKIYMILPYSKKSENMLKLNKHITKKYIFICDHMKTENDYLAFKQMIVYHATQLPPNYSDYSDHCTSPKPTPTLPPPQPVNEPRHVKIDKFITCCGECPHCICTQSDGENITGVKDEYRCRATGIRIRFPITFRIQEDCPLPKSRPPAKFDISELARLELEKP